MCDAQGLEGITPELVEMLGGNLHPNVAQLVAYVADPACPCLVYEAVDGKHPCSSEGSPKPIGPCVSASSAACFRSA